MSNRRALTRVELLVGIGIVIVVAAMALPFVVRSRRVAQATKQRFDFQAIDAALKAYHDDFGDYPRNFLLAKWKTMRDGPDQPPTPAPAFYSLAAALLGPGPGVTQTVDGDLQTGDGNEGPGIRCQNTLAATGTVSATQGKTAVTMTVDANELADAAAFVKSFVGSGNANPTLASVTLLADSKVPYQETIGIGAAAEAGGTLQLTLLAGPCFPHEGRGEIRVAGGKVWGPYLAPGRFRVAFVPSVDSYAAPFMSFGQPMLVDDWGQVIEYFPRYGAMNNRTNDSVYPADATVQAGPLFGYSQPKSADPVNGQNAIWDWRDGSPFFTISGQVGPAQSWPNPVMRSQKSFRPELAIQWMLGEPDAAGEFKNEIGAKQKAGYDGPYILISTGPDGPDRANGGFCNFADPNNDDNPMPASQLQKTFQLSGNLYNFERR